MAGATAVRTRSAPVRSRPTTPRRAPLRVVNRPQRTSSHRRRRLLAAALCFAVGSMLLVGLAQAYVTAGQVRLARLNDQVATAQAHNRDLQMQVASLENPGRVVATGQSQGLTVPAQVTDLPLVSPSGAGGAVRGR